MNNDFIASVMNDELVKDIWARKYRHNSSDGTPMEASVEETRARVVNGIYANDPDHAARALAMDYVQRGLLIPAGRINAGAGLDRSVTLMNCFVSETIQDSLIGIQRSISRAALTMQQGGGIGSDFSTIRPRGALVKRTGSVSSGIIPFMDQQDAMCTTIISSGSRRGAMMGTLRDDHPDLWNEDQFEYITNVTGARVLKAPSFISAKRQPGKLTQFNMSVLVSDAFMVAVENDNDWDLGFHVPRADGQHVDIFTEPFPYDAYDEVNDIFNGVGEGSQTIGGQIPTIKKGTMLPWYVYRRVKARRIWDDIMQSTYKYAEPGIIFIDKVNQRNNLNYCEEIRTTNPCGEQPLPPHGICCLASVNTAFMVNNSFTKEARFDFDLFAKVAQVGVRFLDNVLDVSNYPLTAQRKEAHDKRRIGLGITGWGDALLQLGIKYGSEESISFSRQVADQLKQSSYLASTFLAKERGPFPAYKPDFLKSPNIKQLSAGTKALIREYGIRNGVLNTIAPNGTISMYVGNVSSGHEPIFSFKKTKRKVRQDDGSSKEYVSVDYALRLYEHIHGATAREDLPDYFVGAMDISVADHLAVHAAWQEFIDASISKTINCPPDMTFEDFQNVYKSAYDMGCKGCTTYRPDPDSGRGSVLSVETKETPESVAESHSTYIDILGRPDVTQGMTYKLKWPITGNNWYINITNIDNVPLEMFITGTNAEAHEWISALSRTITAVLRRGGDVRFLVDQLAAVHSSAGGAFIANQHKFRPSVVAAIAGVMEQEFRRLGMYEGGGHEEPLAPLTTEAERLRQIGVTKSKPEEILTQSKWMTDTQFSNLDCPECHNPTLIKEVGCIRCITCGYNSCG